MKNTTSKEYLRVPQIVRRGVVAFALIAGATACNSDEPGVKVISSSTNVGAETLEQALARSYEDQPVTVAGCPAGGTLMVLGAGVQVDALGQGGSGRNYIVIGDAAPEQVVRYDIDGDLVPEAWCGQASEEKREDGLYVPARPDPAYVLAPNWEDCPLPSPGEKLACPSGPLEFYPNAVAEPIPAPTTTMVADA